jgi:hypothetical protein
MILIHLLTELMVIAVLMEEAAADIAIIVDIAIIIPREEANQVKHSNSLAAIRQR